MGKNVTNFNEISRGKFIFIKTSLFVITRIFRGLKYILQTIFRIIFSIKLNYLFFPFGIFGLHKL